MRRFSLLAAMLLSASPAIAQDTIIVRHLAPTPDTAAVVVRHLAPSPDTAVLIRRIPPPMATRVPVVPRQYGFLPPKDPGYGTMLSVLIPGGGQFYAGNSGEGAALALIGFGAPLVGFAAAENNWGHRTPVYSNQCAPERVQPGFFGGSSCGGGYNVSDAAVGVGVGAAAWLFGIVTAGSDVEHWNKLHGFALTSAPGRVGVAIPFP